MRFAVSIKRSAPVPPISRGPVAGRFADVAIGHQLLLGSMRHPGGLRHVQWRHVHVHLHAGWQRCAVVAQAAVRVHVLVGGNVDLLVCMGARRRMISRIWLRAPALLPLQHTRKAFRTRTPRPAGPQHRNTRERSQCPLHHTSFASAPQRSQHRRAHAMRCPPTTTAPRPRVARMRWLLHDTHLVVLRPRAQVSGQSQLEVRGLAVAWRLDRRLEEVLLKAGGRRLKVGLCGRRRARAASATLEPYTGEDGAAVDCGVLAACFGCKCSQPAAAPGARRFGLGFERATSRK